MKRLLKKLEIQRKKNKESKLSMKVKILPSGDWLIKEGEKTEHIRR